MRAARAVAKPGLMTVLIRCSRSSNGSERALHRVDRQPLDVAPAVAERLDQGVELRRQRDPAHQPVVGVDGDPEGQVAQQADRVLLDGGRGAGLHVGGRAHLQRDPAVPDVAGQPAQGGARRPGQAWMSSMIRTPWPSRSAPHHCTASQMDGRPKPSPAWMVMWKFSRATNWKASRWRLGGLPASAPGDVEADHAGVAVPDRQLGDLQRPGRRAHRGEQGVDGDPAARAAAPEALQHGLDDLVQAEPAGQVQLRGEPDLGVRHAVVGQVLGALGGHPDQRLAGLHDPDGVLERLQVQLQRAAVGDLAHPRGQARRGRPRAAPGSRSRRPAPRWCRAAARRPGGRAAGPSGRPRISSSVTAMQPLSQTSQVRRGRPRCGRSRADPLAADRRSRRLVADLDGPVQGVQRPAEPVRRHRPAVPARAGPSATGSPGLARQITPALALTGSSLRARPAPSRQAATPTARASRRRT